VLLPSTPDWRWRLDGETSYWYPGVRLFRKNHEKGTWAAVINATTNELKGLLKNTKATI
jgi:hypothetical protein